MRKDDAAAGRLTVGVFKLELEEQSSSRFKLS